MHQGNTKLMESIFCGKRIVRTVLVLQKYCLYFRDFVGICFDLVFMWRRRCFCPKPRRTRSDKQPQLLFARFFSREGIIVESSAVLHMSIPARLGADWAAGFPAVSSARGFGAGSEIERRKGVGCVRNEAL